MGDCGLSGRGEVCRLGEGLGLWVIRPILTVKMLVSNQSEEKKR